MSRSKGMGRILLTAVLATVLMTGQISAAGPAGAESAQQSAPPTAATTGTAIAAADATNPQLAPKPDHLRPKLTPVPPVDPAPGSVAVDRGPSKALQPIAALPAVDPSAGTVPIDRTPVVPDPPVAPSPLTMPLHPAQELVDATTADAIATLGKAGRLQPNGAPDLDARKLQPQVASAQFIDPAHPATLQDLIAALASGNIPPPLPVDPLALLEKLPDGIPRITYRICSESATKQVSCSLTLPLGVPAIVDVTGDRTPDVLADLVPVAAVGDIVSATQALLDVEQQLAAAQERLSIVNDLLSDPLQVILHPELLIEKLQLTNLITDLKNAVTSKAQALLDLVNLGVGLLELRLPTSELAGKPLPAHLWAVYDLPGHHRVSVGFDGLRRGTTLPTGTLGLFTFNPLELARGVYDIQARLLQGGAGDALAVTAGLTSVTEDDAGNPYQPTVASARFSPVPALFSARARIEPGSGTTDQKVVVNATSDRTTHLDTQVLSNRDGTDEFTQLAVDTLPTQVSATLTRPPGGRAVLDYQASDGIEHVLFADFGYHGTTLDNAVQATAAAIPAAFKSTLANTDTGVNLDYTASSRLAALDVAVYDKPGALVGRGSLRGLPTTVTLSADTKTSRVAFTGGQTLDSATVAISRNLGGFAPYDGDHATLVTAGNALGVSARVTGLRAVDAYYDGHPRLSTSFDPGGQSFIAAGDLGGVHKARLEISNLPTTASLDVDTAARKLAYRTSSVIHRVFAAYTNTVSGPTLFATVTELPARIDLSYDLGDKPRLQYQASSRVQKVEVFASLEHVETLRPQQDHYLSATADGLAASMDYLLDLPARHLEGTQSDPLTALAVVARLPYADRDWTAAADLTGVPSHFDADFAEGTYRFRGLSGPLGSARLAVTNHDGQQAPNGLHLAVHYRQTTGDLDGSVSVRKLSWVEYAHAGGGQTFRLDTDTGGDPVYVDADVLLASGGVDDTRLAATAKVDGLPNTIRSTFADGKLTYTATGNLGLTIAARVGKVAALSDLGAPLFDNGVALVGRGCDTGKGCAKDDSVFCAAFARCLGAVGTVRLPGMPNSLEVDTRARTVQLTGYHPPSASLQAYLRLTGLVDTLPDVRALATLSGLPAALDLTVGPVEVSGGSIRFRYAASAPLGALRFDADAATTDATFPVVRGRASVDKLPATMDIQAAIGDRTTVAVRNSAAVDTIGVTVTSADTGYLTAAVNGVPATADVLVDLPAKHAETTMSAPISAISFLAHVPYGGRTWSAFADVRGVPARFDADWGNGTYAFRAASGSTLDQAAFAVTNHSGALAPSGSHLAAHYTETSGDLDGSASLSGLADAAFSHTGSSITAGYHAAQQTIALDGDVLLAAGGANDTRLAALGRIGPIPGSVTFTSNAGVIDYAADHILDVEVQVWLGKVSALRGLQAPRYANGASVVDHGCAKGTTGCADSGPFCTDRGCFGLTGIVNVSGLPTKVTIDPTKGSYSFEGYQPRTNTLTLYVDDSVFVSTPPRRIRAEATLTDLPSGIHFTLGPIKLDGKLDIAYHSDVTSAGKLDVHAQADEVPTFGSVTALAHLDPIPGELSVTGTVGSPTNVTVKDSAVINSLSLRASGTFDNAPATGLVELRDVPTDMTFGVRGFGSAVGDNVPTLHYVANDGRDTLKADVQVEAKMVALTDPALVRADDLELHITNLGHLTDIGFNPATKIAAITSQPKTDELRMVGNLHLQMPRADQDVTFFNCFNLVKGLFYGHTEVKESWISAITFDLTDVRTANLQPGNVRTDLPFSLPAELGYLFLAFDGSFGNATISMNGVHLDLDIDLYLRIDKIVGPDFFQEHLNLTRLYDTVYFHQYDSAHTSKNTFELSTWGIPLAEITVSTVPGLAQKLPNAVTVQGGRPSLVTMLDPGDDVDDFVFDILAYAAWPFSGEHAPKLNTDSSGDSGGPC